MYRRVRYVPVSRSSMLAVFRTMSSPGTSPETNMFVFVSFAFGAFLVSSQNEFLPLNPGIFNLFFCQETQDYLFWRLRKIPYQEQIRYIGQNLDWCCEHMYYCSEFVILCALNPHRATARRRTRRAGGCLNPSPSYSASRLCSDTRLAVFERA